MGVAPISASRLLPNPDEPRKIEWLHDYLFDLRSPERFLSGAVVESAYQENGRRLVRFASLQIQPDRDAIAKEGERSPVHATSI